MYGHQDIEIWKNDCFQWKTKFLFDSDIVSSDRSCEFNLVDAVEVNCSFSALNLGKIAKMLKHAKYSWSQFFYFQSDFDIHTTAF